MGRVKKIKEVFYFAAPWKGMKDYEIRKFKTGFSRNAGGD
jgi:hypothetical protein